MRRRLTPESMQLFREMVDTHLAAGPGDKLFMRADDMEGNNLFFAGPGASRDWRDFDGGSLDDLVAFGLLHQSFGGQGTPNYRVGGEALAFHRWLMAEEGSAVDQVSEKVQHLVTGADFAAKHPGAAHHLQQALELLWEGRTDIQVVSEIGDHLRKALMDTTTDLVGTSAGGEQEKPVERLKEYLATRPLSERERVVIEQLVELARVVLRLDHRLNHVRDEADKDESPVTWEEVRRAAFVTVLVVYELSRA